MKKYFNIVITSVLLLMIISGCSKQGFSVSYESDFRPMLDAEYEVINSDFYTDIKQLKVCRFMFTTSIYDEVIMEALDVIDFGFRFKVGSKVLAENDVSIFEITNTSQTSIWEDY